MRTLPCPDFILDLVPETPADVPIYSEGKQNRILHRLKRICAKNSLPDINLHGLRHSNASAMLTIMPDKYAMARGGWSSNNTMKQIYQHRFDAKQTEYNRAIDNHFAALYDKAQKQNGPDN